ncbi:MAG: hypothetical protein HYX35_02445 [Proteobacteria bacterium]|nr:hypothetical protein [Pseudomonadota bacterium]
MNKLLITTMVLGVVFTLETSQSTEAALNSNTSPEATFGSSQPGGTSETISPDTSTSSTNNQNTTTNNTALGSSVNSPPSSLKNYIDWKKYNNWTDFSDFWPPMIVRGTPNQVVK